MCTCVCVCYSITLSFFSPGLKKWVEVGNSGVFRPEMLLPMGLPEDVSVIAWGLSLERWVWQKVGHFVHTVIVYSVHIKFKIEDVGTGNFVLCALNNNDFEREKLGKLSFEENFLPYKGQLLDSSFY